MNKLYKTMVAALLGLAAVATTNAATYNQHLVAGFTSQSGNDLIYDLGVASSLTNGQSWSLSAALSAAGHTSDYASLQWGVVGATNNGLKSYSTSLITPPTVLSYTDIKTIVATMYQNFPASGTGQYVATPASGGASWFSETTVDGGLASPTSFISVWTDPNQAANQLGSAINFYQAAEGSAPTVFGTFTFDNTGKLTFNLPSNNPPVPQIVSVTRTNTTSYITFTTTNGSFNYSLCFTNSSGLASSVTNWPKAGTVLGDGSNKTLTDTTTDANRFYRVRVQ